MMMMMMSAASSGHFVTPPPLVFCSLIGVNSVCARAHVSCLSHLCWMDVMLSILTHKLYYKALLCAVIVCVFAQVRGGGWG